MKISEILCEGPSDIRNAIARSSNKLQALQHELNMRRIVL